MLARLPVQYLLTCHLRTLAGGGGGIGVGSLARTAVKRVEGQGGEQARSAGYRGVRVWCVLARLHILNPAPSTAQQSPHLYSRSTAASSAARSASTLDPNRSLSNLAKAVARAASCASARAELCTGRCCCSRLRENRGVGRVGIGCCAVHECLLVQLLHARKPCAQSEKQAAPKHARVAPPADVHILARLHQLAVEVLHQAAGCSQTARGAEWQCQDAGTPSLVLSLGASPAARPATPQPSPRPTSGDVAVVQPLHHALDEVGQGGAVQRLALHHLCGREAGPGQRLSSWLGERTRTSQQHAEPC